MYDTYLQFFLFYHKKFILDTQKQMSDKKMGLAKIDLHRDQQFQISSLIEDSSEGSSRRDEGYEIKNYDVSDDQQHDKKSIKSLQQIQTHDIEKQMKNSPNLSNRSQENEQLPERAFNNQQPKQLKDDFEISRTSAFETQNKVQILNSKRKRQRIFRNSRKSNVQRPVNLQQGAQESESKLKQTLNRVAFEKKRENHTILKHWNYCRIRKLEFHRAIADEIVANIDKNVKIALQNLQVYKSFYTQRVRQQQIYANTIFTDSDRLLQNDQTLQNNDHSSRIYIACSSIIQAVARKDKRQKQIAQNLATTIQTKILKGIFEEYFDNVHKQSLSIRQKINQFKASLQKIDESVCNKLISLQTNFTQCCQDVNQEAGKDFYRLELSFLRKCETQMIIQAKYGQIIVEYYNFVISEQEMRRQLIQKSLRLYDEAVQKYHLELKQITKQKQKQQEQSKIPQHDTQEQKQSDRNKIKQIYELKNLINNQQMQKLQQQITKNYIDKPRNKQISQQTFLLFFQKCQIQYFDSHHLIFKKFDVALFKQTIWVAGFIVISVDKFVHFFINIRQQQAGYACQKFLKPQITIKANLLEIIAEQEADEGEGVQVKVVSKASQSRLDKLKSLIKTSQKMEQKVKFNKQSDFIEFEDYINNFSQ